MRWIYGIIIFLALALSLAIGLLMGWIYYIMFLAVALSFIVGLAGEGNTQE